MIQDMTQYTARSNRFLRPHRNKRTELDKLKAKWRSLILIGGTFVSAIDETMQRRVLQEMKNMRE